MLKRINIPYRVLVRSSQVRDAAGDERCHALLELLVAAETTRDNLRHCLSSLGLTEVQFQTLLIMLALAPAPAFPAILAENIGVRRSSITSALDGLHAKGFLSRERSKVDRRNWALTLTGAGHVMADLAIDSVLNALAVHGQALTPPAPLALQNLCSQLLGPRLVS